jgi:hypothetical protein
MERRKCLQLSSGVDPVKAMRRWALEFRAICAVALRALLCVATFNSIGLASPATFVTALPVAKGQWLIRFNAQQTLGTSSFVSAQFPVNNAYGLTPRWRCF